MDDRYPVAIGYPDASTPSGMANTPRLRAHLSQTRFAKWGELLSTLSESDKAVSRKAREACKQAMPPVGSPPPDLMYVMIKQQVDDGDGWITHTAALSLGSIAVMIEFMVHHSAVEDELEAELQSDWTP